jgi:peptidoglycan glycosyltransferase
MTLPPMSSTKPSLSPPPKATPARERERRRRLLALGLIAALPALVAGLVIGARHEDSASGAVRSFLAAWERQDYGAMYAQLGPAARRRTSPRRLVRTYREAAETLTLESVQTGRPGKIVDGRVQVPVALRTRIFGTVRGLLTLSVEQPSDGEPGVDWRANQVVPGLRPRERLARQTRMPTRAAIEARDGTVLAEGDGRVGEADPLASQVVGTIGVAPPERAEALKAQGVPTGAAVGLTGLEREFDDQLRGTPGGTLYAGERVIADTSPQRGSTAHTTIDPKVQKAAVEALAGRFGGIAVVRPRTGEVLALAGIAYSAPQPPGSTFKIVTLAGALQSGVVKRSAHFPVSTSATLEGVELQNANGESCGGSLEASFAESCNSVFAPIGARLGASRLVEAAQRFGFNEQPSLLGAARSTIPAAREIGDDLAVGSSAIGQGKVLTTPLLMATIAAAIGERGMRPIPTLSSEARARRVRATTAPVARTIRRYMRAVVRSGTGAGAAIPGVAVAGKTGTAELRTTVKEEPAPPQPGDEPQPPPEEDKSDTDAWFTAFAPAGRPRVAVAVLLVGQGAGGETAAPAARQVLEAALKR